MLWEIPNLWWLQGHSEPGPTRGPVSSTEAWRSLCYPGWRKEVFKAGLVTGVPNSVCWTKSQNSTSQSIHTEGYTLYQYTRLHLGWHQPMPYSRRRWTPSCKEFPMSSVTYVSLSQKWMRRRTFAILLKSYSGYNGMAWGWRRPSANLWSNLRSMYLGHCIDAQGLYTTDSKLIAITEAPNPKNVQELRSFLGLLNYYGKFIPNLATILHPLNQLLRHGHRWEWTADCTQAFKHAKDMLTSSKVLAHFDPTLPIKLAADASTYGVGAVIAHVQLDGSKRPIAFASRTLSPSERNYAQIEKEALALVFGVKKFH